MDQNVILNKKSIIEERVFEIDKIAKFDSNAPQKIIFMKRIKLLGQFGVLNLSRKYFYIPIRMLMIFGSALRGRNILS